MAERRMFTKKITESDAFLDMPMSTQCLYFHLNMSADDDGFVNNPKKIMRCVGACEDDFKLLIAKSFIISFDTGVIVIKHWKMHNYLRSDRYKPTDYTEEKSMLGIKKDNSYTLDENKMVYQMDTKCTPSVSIGKDRIGKDRIGKDIYMTFPLKDGNEYELDSEFVEEMKSLYPKLDVDQELKSAKAWLLGNPTRLKTSKGMKRFLTGWLGRAKPNEPKAETKKNKFNNFESTRKYDFAALEEEMANK